MLETQRVLENSRKLLMIPNFRLMVELLLALEFCKHLASKKLSDKWEILKEIGTQC
jgi:hypothetical protein